MRHIAPFSYFRFGPPNAQLLRKRFPIFQILNSFAPEHGKGECDGETAIMKNRVGYLFKKGSLLMTLEELCDELRKSLSVPSRSVATSARAIHERRFISVPGTANFFRTCKKILIYHLIFFFHVHIFLANSLQLEHFLLPNMLFWEVRHSAATIPFWRYETHQLITTTAFSTAPYLAVVRLA